MRNHRVLLVACVAFSTIFVAHAAHGAQKDSASNKQLTVSASTLAFYAGIAATQFRAPLELTPSEQRPTPAPSKKCYQLIPRVGVSGKSVVFSADCAKTASVKEQAKKVGCKGHTDCWVSSFPQLKLKPKTASRLQRILNEQLQEMVHG